MKNAWQGAADWLRNNYQDYANVASLCDAMAQAAPTQPEAKAEQVVLSKLEQEIEREMTAQELRVALDIATVAACRASPETKIEASGSVDTPEFVRMLTCLMHLARNASTDVEWAAVDKKQEALIAHTAAQVEHAYTRGRLSAIDDYKDVIKDTVAAQVAANKLAAASGVPIYQVLRGDYRSDGNGAWDDMTKPQYDTWAEQGVPCRIVYTVLPAQAPALPATSEVAASKGAGLTDEQANVIENAAELLGKLDAQRSTAANALRNIIAALKGPQ